MATNHWWVVWYTPAANGKFTSQPSQTYALIQAPSSEVARNKIAQVKGVNAIIGAVDGPYSTRNEATNAAQNKTSQIQKDQQGGSLPNILGDLNPLHWLSSMGGYIASGIEGGFLSVIKDLWDIIIGPLEIIVGSIIIMFVLTIYFKDDLFAAARIVGMAAA